MTLVTKKALAGRAQRLPQEHKKEKPRGRSRATAGPEKRMILETGCGLVHGLLVAERAGQLAEAGQNLLGLFGTAS